jgi:hypothetical protein
VHGAASVAHRESSPGNRRAFCTRCGSVAPLAGAVFDLVPAGLLDDDPGIRPLAHLFVGSMPPWYEITDELPRNEAYPPGLGEPIAFERSTVHADGEVRGSCLCGGVAYAVDRTIEGPIVFCHCGRCRKARAAAHAANCFVALDRFRWLRGEEQVRTYKVPEAQRFTHAFCAQCGGSVPLVAPARGVVVIPSPTFDDDPGARPELHIFVASKAPWDVISDDLPQHAAAPPGEFPPPSRR